MARWSLRTLQAVFFVLCWWGVAAFSILLVHRQRPSSFSPCRQHDYASTTTLQSVKNDISTLTTTTSDTKYSPFEVHLGSLSRKILIHWRGERDTGYSKGLRHLEFCAALAATVNATLPTSTTSSSPLELVDFVNALNYTGEEVLPDCRIEHFNEAMQYLSFPQEHITGNITRQDIITAVQRCSLVHAAYEVVASSDHYEDLAELGLQDGGLEDLYTGGIHQDQSWIFRVRRYGQAAPTSNAKDKRYGEKARSMEMERRGLELLKPLLIKLGGKVDMRTPDCPIYVFDGLENTQKVLTRRIANGPKTSGINPNTRICVTNTPLEPIAAFALCNVAQIQHNSRVLDPYCGSAATLLAASLIAPDCETVGIEISHNGIINRDDIEQDFTSRGLALPKALIYGDSTNTTIRDEARAAIGNRPFTAIVTDPPYGIRESSRQNERTPMEDMFEYIAADRDAGRPLLKVGGRLVAFVPVTDEETLARNLPGPELAKRAGLEYELAKEQQLNEKLSRWLVSYKCTRS